MWLAVVFFIITYLQRCCHRVSGFGGTLILLPKRKFLCAAVGGKTACPQAGYPVFHKDTGSLSGQKEGHFSIMCHFIVAYIFALFMNKITQFLFPSEKQAGTAAENPPKRPPTKNTPEGRSGVLKNSVRLGAAVRAQEMGQASFWACSFTSLIRVPLSRNSAIRLGMAIMPLQVSAMPHSKPRSTVAPGMATSE